MTDRIPVEVHPDAATLARAAARYVAAQARASVEAAGRFAFAVSGGSTPALMFAALAGETVPWARVHLFQVDERVVPDGHPDRNFTTVERELLARVPPPGGAYPMPVTGDLAAGARAYESALRHVCGDPPVLDLVHLGLGEDGHTASLVPGDPVLGVDDADVAVTREYKGFARLTLTYPALDRAADIMWLVSGAAKAAALRRLFAGDPGIPAGRVRADAAVVFADAAAAG